MSEFTPNGAYDELALKSWLWQKAARALNAPDSDISERRQELLDQYLGQPYHDEEEGYSRVVTRETFEAVEWSMPSATRVFLGGTAPVTYKAVNEKDKRAAKQEAEYVMHLLRLTNNWYESCTQWMRAAHIYPNSYAKLWWDIAEESELTEYEGQTEMQLALLENDPDTIIVEASSRIVEIPMLGPMELFDITCRHAQSRGRMMFAPVPPEEVLIDNDIAYQNLDMAEWVCHHRRATRDELVKSGFDRDMVWGLPTAENLEYSSEKENRARYHDEDPHYSDDYGAMEKVDLYESYGWYDWDDDGRAEFRKMVFAGSSGTRGNSILENREVDYQPLLCLAITPQPYRHPGVPIAEMTEQIQRNNTVLARQGNDNLYRTNRPRQIADPNRVNVDQLMSYAPFGVVEGDPDAVAPEVLPTVVQQVVEYMRFWKEEGQARTGISRHTMGLDADTLARSTMGAFMGAIGQASAREELIVRDFAETGFAGVFRKAHHLVRKHQRVEDTFELRGEWIDVNPQNWRKRTQIVVKVGTGTGSQQERIGSSMALLDVQREALQVGLTTEERIYNTLDDLTSAMGKSDVNRYFVDPKSDEGLKLAKQRQQARQAQQQAMQKQTDKVLETQTAETSRKSQKDESDNLIQLFKLRGDAEKEANRSAEKRTELETESGQNVPGALV